LAALLASASLLTFPQKLRWLDRSAKLMHDIFDYQETAS
jgi:hypothetical protein